MTIHRVLRHHWFHILLVLLSALPLLYPAIPPLVDLPGHMGRYRVELDFLTHPQLHQFYDFHWQMIGNLGIDLLIIPVSKIFGLEFGMKLIVIAIEMLTVGGLLWISREVHGKVMPSAFFALPLAYGHPFMFGFVNYTLSMAIALNAFALWLRLERLGRYRLRAIVFLLLAPLIWLCHAFGWGALCLLCASAEIVHQHDRTQNWLKAVTNAAKQGLVLVPPLLLMILWRSGHVSGATGGWFGWETKLAWYNETLRDKWRAFDNLSVTALTLICIFAIHNPWFKYSRNLAATALILFIVFLFLPYVVFGSAYADMRLTPYFMAIAVVGIRMKPAANRAFCAVMASVGVIFFAARTIGTTMSFVGLAQSSSRALGALDHVPEDARLLSFVGRKCLTTWDTNRMEHLPALAIVRRHAFSNDQWDMAGAQLLRSNYPQGSMLERHFGHDPSQMVTMPTCTSPIWRTLNWSLSHFPRDKFDYVWLLDPPPFDGKLLDGMTLIWADGSNALYKVTDHIPMRPTE